MNDGQLNEGRDLAVTTDYRSVLGEIMSKHLGDQLERGISRLRERSPPIPRPDQI